AAITTRAPASARPRANALPRPWLPPVTSAVRPVRSKGLVMMVLRLLRVRGFRNDNRGMAQGAFGIVRIGSGRQERVLDVTQTIAAGEARASIERAGCGRALRPDPGSLSAPAGRQHEARSIERGNAPAAIRLSRRSVRHRLSPALRPT